MNLPPFLSFWRNLCYYSLCEWHKDEFNVEFSIWENHQFLPNLGSQLPHWYWSCISPVPNKSSPSVFWIKVTRCLLASNTDGRILTPVVPNLVASDVVHVRVDTVDIKVVYIDHITTYLVTSTGLIPHLQHRKVCAKCSLNKGRIHLYGVLGTKCGPTIGYNFSRVYNGESHERKAKVVVTFTCRPLLPLVKKKKKILHRFPSYAFLQKEMGQKYSDKMREFLFLSYIVYL